MTSSDFSDGALWRTTQALAPIARRSASISRSRLSARFESAMVGDTNIGSPFARRSRRAPAFGTRAVAVFASQRHLPLTTITFHG
jgi:hypothetical protein